MFPFAEFACDEIPQTWQSRCENKRAFFRFVAHLRQSNPRRHRRRFDAEVLRHWRKLFRQCRRLRPWAFGADDGENSAKARMAKRYLACLEQSIFWGGGRATETEPIRAEPKTCLR